MKFSTTAIIMAAAMGASAHPSGHAHQKAHRSIEQRDGHKFVKYAQPVVETVTEIVHAKPTGVTNAAEQQKPAYEAPEPQPKPKAPEPEPEPAAPKYEPPKETKPKTSPKSNSGKNGKGLTSYAPLCGNKKRATAADIHYVGNTGAPDDYGCNLQMVANKEVAHQYRNKVNIKAVGKQFTCSCWLKIGPDGGLTTSFEGKDLFGFTLDAGSDQWVVADSDTQAVCACDNGSKMQYAPMNRQIAGVWAEFDVESKVNDKWCGADVSVLVASRYGLSHPQMKMCAVNSASPCSVVYSDGTGEHAFTKGMEYEDGHGINEPPSKDGLTLMIEVS